MSGRHRKLRIFKWQTAAPALLLKIRWIILKILVCCSLANDLKEKWTFTKIKTFLRKSFCSFWLIKKTSNALSKLKHCKGYKGKSIFYSNICKCGFANHCWWSWILGLFQAFKEYNVCQISHDAFSDLINHHDRWHQARFSHSDKLISQTVKELGEKRILLIGSVVWSSTKNWTHLWKCLCMVGIRRYLVILLDPHTEFNKEKQTIATISVPNPSYSLEYPHIKSHLIESAATKKLLLDIRVFPFPFPISSVTIYPTHESKLLELNMKNLIYCA